MKVLAEATGEVAADRAKGEGTRSGQKVVQRFFLNRVDGEPAGEAVGFGNQLVTDSFADKARAALAVGDAAAPRAERTFNQPVLLQMPVSCRFHSSIIKRISHRGNKENEA